MASIRSTRSCGTKGCLRYSSAPSSSAIALSTPSPTWVSSSTGTQFSSCRRRLSTCRPSAPGMSTSSTQTSGPWRWISSRASSPSLAGSTRNPERSRKGTTAPSTSGSSSATRTSGWGSLGLSAVMAVSSASALPVPVELSGLATLNSVGEFVSVQQRTTQVLGAIAGSSDHVRGHGDRHQLEGDDDRQSRHRRPGRELDGDRHGDEDQPQHLRLRTRVHPRQQIPEARQTDRGRQRQERAEEEEHGRDDVK